MINAVLAIDINPTTFAPAQIGSIASLLNIIIPLLMSVAAIIFLFMLILGGYAVLTASGDPEKVKKAQKIFQFSIVGLIIIIVSYVFVKLLGIIFKINFPF
jgi:heme O synthase-like polyprenyltransferase